MHTINPPHHDVPIAARLLRAAALSLCETAARLYRAAQAVERNKSPDDERRYAQALLVSHGKLD